MGGKNGPKHLLSSGRRSDDPRVPAATAAEDKDANKAPDSRPGRRVPVRRVVAVAAVLFLASAVVSYTRFVLKPSSLPLGVRTVEWVRAHNGNWIVDKTEHLWYSWRSPKKGGPQLKSLPSVGVAPVTPSPKEHRVAPWPPPIKPVFPHPLPGEGVWKRTG